MTVHELSARELQGAYAARELSPVEVVGALAQRREALAGALNAYVGHDAQGELAAAKQAERRYAAGAAVGPLDGVPIAVKDLIDTADLPTTYGSGMFRGHRPAADAPVVAAARRAGAIVAGKTATHEFAWGITTENPHFGACRNPWDRRRVPGGSSGGSGVAVASGQAPLAFGTDTAGSVRIPAAFCGVVGFKPTFGLLPVGGIFALAPSLDHVGFLGRDPGDVADLFGALLPRAGRRALVAGPQDGAAPALDSRVGVLDLPGASVLEAEVRRALDDAAGVVERLGARVDAVTLGGEDDRTQAMRRVQAVEAFRVHHAAGLFPARAAEYGDDVRERLEMASALTLDDYLAGLEAMRRIREHAERLFDGVDLLVTPVAACAPPPIGQAADLRDHVLPHTVLQSLSGLPACVVRAGFDDDGLPVGMQLTGPRFADLDVLGAAAAFVQATAELQARRPQLLSGRAG
jgi:aspartyl-tRNA(Asn)/glutamyl-tRNA(Gln) amidotransferase subunit A